MPRSINVGSSMGNHGYSVNSPAQSLRQVLLSAAKEHFHFLGALLMVFVADLQWQRLTGTVLSGDA